jgi:hypothetical protein
MLKYNAQHKIRFALELKKGSLQKTISKKRRKKNKRKEWRRKKEVGRMSQCVRAKMIRLAQFSLQKLLYNERRRKYFPSSHSISCLLDVKMNNENYRKKKRKNRNVLSTTSEILSFSNNKLKRQKGGEFKGWTYLLH